MNIIVFIIGLLISLACILLLIAPNYVKNFFKKFLEKEWMFYAVAIRIVLGICFIIASEQTRYPSFIYWLGIAIFIAAIFLPIVGKDRLNKFIKSWLGYPSFVMIIWAIIGFLLGLFIMYASNIYV